MSEPTERDLANAAARDAIASKQNAAYAEAYRLALGTLGPGFTPWMKISLIPADHRQTGDATPAAVAYKMYRGEERTSENAVYLRRMPDGTIRRATSYEPLFGPMLDEKHSTMTVQVRGQQVPVGRYEVVWSAMEEYHPRSADALAKTRQTRERNKAAKEEAAWREEAPLFTTWADRNAQEEPDSGHSGP